MRTDNTIDPITDLVRRDRSIPGLGLMLDPARLLAAMSGRLDCSRVDDIKLVYLRYKPGMNCLARYDLYAGGHTINAYAKSHGLDASSKLRKAMERPVIDSNLGAGRLVLEDQQVIFSTFPNDAKLTSLLRLGEAGYRQRLFRRVFSAGSGWQDSTLAQVLNYKPERRYVVRLRREDGNSALAKFYTHSGFTKAWSVSRRLSGGINSHIPCPEIIGQSKKHAVIAYRWQPGDSLRELTTQGKLSNSTIAATARLLAEFHASEPAGLLSPDPAQRVESITALGEQAGFLLPHLQQRAMRVAQALVEWLGGQPPVRQSVHGDFYDKQVIVDGGNVRLIDLDGACLDNPLVDLGSYVAHLERHAIYQSVTTSVLEAQQQTLVTAYEQAAGRVSQDQLTRYIALGLFRLIHHPFRDWAEDWPEQMEQLLERVESLLST